MFIKVSKLIATLQEQLAEHGDCPIAIRNNVDSLHPITGTGNTINLEDVPELQIKTGDKIFWISTLDPKVMNKIYNSNADSEELH